MCAATLIPEEVPNNSLMFTWVIPDAVDINDDRVNIWQCGLHLIYTANLDDSRIIFAFSSSNLETADDLVWKDGNTTS